MSGAPVVIDRDGDGRMVFGAEHAQLISDLIAPKATPAEISVFLMQARRLDFDPFVSGQIWLVPRYDSRLKRTVHRTEVGIAGFRTAAERTGLYGGTCPNLWLDADGRWVDVWLDDNTPPAAARATVKRKDWAEPHVETLTWSEAAVWNPVWKDGKTTGQLQLAPLWKQRPAGQLAKCAEAAALRRCFPDLLAGVYVDGELGEHGPDPVASQRAPEIDPAVKKPFDEFMTLIPELSKLIDVDLFKDAIVELAADRGLGAIESFAASAITPEQAELMLSTARETIEQAAL